MTDSPKARTRREFLGRASTGAALLALAPGVRLVELVAAKGDDQPASALQRWGLLVDVNRCASGCDACV